MRGDRAEVRSSTHSVPLDVRRPVASSFHTCSERDGERGIGRKESEVFV